ncbi:MAG: hypothetical protein U1E45_13385 [Geminicoccaceae bacterium]
MKLSGLAASVVVIMAAVPAAADMIASPPIFGGLSQKFAYCYIFNASSTSMRIEFIDLWSDTGIKTRLSSDSCKVSASNPVLAAYTGCYSYTSIVNDRAYSCRVTLTGKANARSSIEITNQLGTTLNRAELR